jgi:hypothetical protein
MSTPKGYELLPALIGGPGRFAAEDPRLVAGDHVKVGFKTDPPPKGERRGWPEREWMWLEVTAAVGAWPGVAYRGELRNRPFFIDGLAVGHPVEFRPGEIYDVVRDSPDRPESEQEKMAVDRTDLDAMAARGCQAPGCDHKGHSAEVWLHPRCHVRARIGVRYESGKLFLSCEACKKTFLVVAVAD